MGEVGRSEYLNDATVCRRLKDAKRNSPFFFIFRHIFGPFAIMTSSVSQVSGSLK